jgi:ribosomal protein S18 acetylase RimI-like enzyme
MTARSLTFSHEPVFTESLAAALRPIYETSFPPAERESYASLAGNVAEGRYRLFVARQAGEPVGMAIVYPLPEVAAVYLPYMAIASLARSRGIGGRLFDFVAGELAAAGGATGLIFEVEAEADSPADEVEIRRRRIAFYQRHGASIIECAPHYRAPDLSGPGLVRFTLMWRPLAGPPGTPSGGRLRELVQAVLWHGYGLDSEHALVQAALRDLAC